MKAAYGFLAVCVIAATVSASTQAPADVGERAKGAKKVMVGTVTDVQAEFGENDYGDHLILSHVSVRVDETLKGVPEGAVVVTLEGGTVGDLTLEVSDMPQMTRGQRAVLFVEDSKNGGYVPHRRGSGVMKLGDDDRVEDSDLTLDDIRAAVRAAQR
jgi:hypothetical protein